MICIVCRGVEFRVSQRTAEKLPLLRSAAVEAGSDILEVRRDPAVLGELLEYCRSGLLPLKISHSFFLEADYWGLPTRTHLSLRVLGWFNAQEVPHDCRVFVERVFNTGAGSRPVPPPVFDVVVPCREYLVHDRWSPRADAYKYVVGHPDAFRSTAFSRYGIDLSWELFPSATLYSLGHTRAVETGETVFNDVDWVIPAGAADVQGAVLGWAHLDRRESDSLPVDVAGTVLTFTLGHDTSYPLPYLAVTDICPMGDPLVLTARAWLLADEGERETWSASMRDGTWAETALAFQDGSHFLHVGATVSGAVPESCFLGISVHGGGTLEMALRSVEEVQPPTSLMLCRLRVRVLGCTR